MDKTEIDLLRKRARERRQEEQAAKRQRTELSLSSLPLYVSLHILHKRDTHIQVQYTLYTTRFTR